MSFAERWLRTRHSATPATSATPAPETQKSAGSAVAAPTLPAATSGQRPTAEANQVAPGSMTEATRRAAETGHFSNQVAEVAGVAGVTAEGAAREKGRVLDLTSPHAMFEHTLAHELARRRSRPEAERQALASGAVAWVMHHEGDHERIEHALARVEVGGDARQQLEQLLA